MSEPTWVLRWRVWMAEAPSRPGIWRLKGGGFFVRAKVGRTQARTMTLRDASLQEAEAALVGLRADMRATRPTANAKRTPLFAVYAVELFERKCAMGKIKSKSGRSKWARIIALHLAPAFGTLALEELTRQHVTAWLLSYAPRVAANMLPTKKEREAADALDPQTVNTWFDVLRVIVTEAAREHDLPRNVCAGVEKFSVAEHPTYTDEEPNSLTAAEARAFLAEMLKSYPQHYAMALLGFVTGLRPSHFRPLRRRGPDADVLWREQVLLVRRSHSEGQEVMNTTKSGKRQRIGLPAVVVVALHWHVTTQLTTPAQRASDLLFPSEVGGCRYGSVLDKPFAAVCKTLALGKSFTARGMRRTYQDLAREAQVADLVTRSVSGHATAEMQAHYSTVPTAEQRAALTLVVGLLDVKPAGGGGVTGGVKPPDDTGNL